MFLNCAAGEYSWESLGLQDWTMNPKGNQPWVFTGRTDAKAEVPILWPPDAKSQFIGKDPAWCWERLKAKEEEDDKGWDGWMASLTQWTWIWANSGRWWRTEKPGMLQSMGSQRVGHNLATEQQQSFHSSLWPNRLLFFFNISLGLSWWSSG